VITELGFGPAMVELFGVFIIKSGEVWEQHRNDDEKLCGILN
jgi:hypothetical protein